MKVISPNDMSPQLQPQAQPDYTPSPRTLVTFGAATTVFWMSLYFYVPILSPYSEHLGATLGMVGLIVGSYGFTQLMLRIPTGIWSDRLGSRRPFILAGFIFSFLSALGLGLANDPWVLLIFRTIAGAAATTWVAFTVMFSGHFTPEKAIFAMGIMNFCSSLGQMAATFFGGLAAEIYGWRAPFHLSAITALVGLCLMLSIKERAFKLRSGSIQMHELLTMGRTPMLLIVSSLGAIIQYATFVTVYGFTPVYAARMGASKTDLGILGFATILPTTIANLATGVYLIRYFRKRTIISIGFTLTGISALMVPLMRDIWSLSLSQAVGGWARGMVFTVLMGLAVESIPVQKRATAMGFFQAIYSLGMFMGPAISGVIGDVLGLEMIFITTGILSLATGAIVYKAQLKRRAGAEPSIYGPPARL
ncbi:MAG: MFS transporter [Firmicutes bacterium]|nr:MFS transporter [Bacillota bacterium]